MYSQSHEKLFILYILHMMSHRDCNNNKQNFNHKRTVNKNKNHWVFIVPLSMRHPVINNDLTENIARSWRIYRLVLHCHIANDTTIMYPSITGITYSWQCNTNLKINHLLSMFSVRSLFITGCLIDIGTIKTEWFLFLFTVRDEPCIRIIIDY